MQECPQCVEHRHVLDTGTPRVLKCPCFIGDDNFVDEESTSSLHLKTFYNGKYFTAKQTVIKIFYEAHI